MTVHEGGAATTSLEAFRLKRQEVRPLFFQELSDGFATMNVRTLTLQIISYGIHTTKIVQLVV